MTTCRASSSSYTGRDTEGGYFYIVVPRLWVPAMKITRSWIISVSAFLGNFGSFNARRTLYYPVINVVSKHVGGWSVQWTGRGIFLYRMKICSYFQAGISDNRDWEIAVPGRKSRFSKRIFWDGGFEAVRGSSWLELSNFELCIRGEIWNRMERYRGELISSPRIFTYCLILVSICFSIISFYFNSSRVLRRFMKRNVVFNVRITFQINDARFLSIFYSNQLINYQII